MRKSDYFTPDNTISYIYDEMAFDGIPAAVDSNRAMFEEGLISGKAQNIRCWLADFPDGGYPQQGDTISENASGAELRVISTHKMPPFVVLTVGDVYERD